MANYNLVANSNFQPYTFELYLLPYLIYDKAYREVEDGLTLLLSKANMLETLALEAKDLDTYNTIQSHINKILELASSLASEGLTPQNRAALNLLKIDSSEVIAPIEKKFERRQLLIDELRKKGPEYFYDIDYSEVPLSQMDMLSSYKTFSGKLIASNTAVMASSLANYIENSSIGDKLQLYINMGASPQEVMLVIQEDPNGNKLLSLIYELAKKSSGAYDINKEGDFIYGNSTRENANRFIDAAMFSAVGKAIENRNFKSPNVYDRRDSSGNSQINAEYSYTDKNKDEWVYIPKLRSFMNTRTKQLKSIKDMLEYQIIDLGGTLPKTKELIKAEEKAKEEAEKAYHTNPTSGKYVKELENISPFIYSVEIDDDEKIELNKISIKDIQKARPKEVKWSDTSGYKGKAKDKFNEIENSNGKSDFESSTVVMETAPDKKGRKKTFFIDLNTFNKYFGKYPGTIKTQTSTQEIKSDTTKIVVDPNAEFA